MPTLAKWTFVGYMAVLVGVLLVGLGRLWRRRTVDLLPLVVMGFWGAFACWHLRAVSDATLMTFPLVAAGLGSARWARRQGAVWGGLACLIALSVLVSWLGGRDYWRDGAWRWTRSAPVCLDSAITRLGLSGRVYSPYTSMDLFLKFHPIIRIPVTWEYVAGHERWVEFVGALQAGNGGKFRAYLDKYHVDVLHWPAHVEAPVHTWGDWSLIYLDDYDQLWVRQPTALPIYRYIRPWEHVPVWSSTAGKVLTEANQALQQCPEGATFAWVYKADALRRLGREQEALEAERQKVPVRMIMQWGPRG